MMEHTLYAAMIILCIMVDGMLLWQLLRDVDQSSTQRALEKVFLVCMLMMSLDLVWSLHDSGLFPLTVWSAVGLNTLYFLCSGYASWLWFCFSETFLQAKWLGNRKKRLLFLLPFLGLCVVLIVNMFTGCIFTISNEGHYVRGDLYLLQVVLAYCYLIPSALSALMRASKTDNRMSRGDCLVLAQFMILPVLGGVLQVLIPGLPALFAGITLSMLMFFIRSQSRAVSLDTLTHINNRNSFYKHMSMRLQGDCSNLWMLFIDGDHFKMINDTWGHNAGDEALVHIA